MTINTELTRVDTLIITVGTRQVGWRCTDGIIRCFGADGDRGHPKHIDELYQKLEIKRNYHEEENNETRWGVRDLGERYYQHCQEWLDNDFSAIELLIDDRIIADSVQNGLKQIILWATDQPETVSWKYRRLDTLWLAKLMEGKIKSTWKDLKVDVLHPQINAGDRQAMRQEIEEFIIPLSLESLDRSQSEPLVLLIENKGATPAMAETLEICSAALIRQFQVVQVNPEEPNPQYQNNSALASVKYKITPISEYFWSLEKQQVIASWKTGNFYQAVFWLKAHQNRHKLLYQLAQYLSLSTNWEISNFFKNNNFVNGWLNSNELKKISSEKLIKEWKEQIKQIRQDKFLETWESTFLIEISLQQQNYTSAFIQFAQTLERLLYLNYQTNKWLQKGYISLPEYWNSSRGNYEPTFNDLIKGWCQSKTISKSDRWYELLNKIRDRRNKIIHKAEPITLSELRSLWDKSLSVIKTNYEQEVKELIIKTLKNTCDRTWNIPDKTILSSMYELGLEIISFPN